jgi:hypothetical protein
MFFGKSLPDLLLVFINCYLKEVATNTHPWGHEITIQNCHLIFRIDFSSTKKSKGLNPLILWSISKSGLPLVSTNHIAPFFWALGQGSKNGSIVYPFPQNPWPIPHNTKKKKKKSQKIGKKRGRIAGRGRWTTIGRPPALAICPGVDDR